MPLSSLHQHYRTIIDSAFLDTLDGFHELPESDAVEALNFLANQEILDAQALTYMPLPEVFREQRFEIIQEELTTLHLIMQNRQPEMSVKSHIDQGNELGFGVFNLVKNQTPAQPITRGLVRDYLINQFLVKVRLLKTLSSIVFPMLAIWKEKHNAI